VTSTQVVFSPTVDPEGGLRERKRARTRAAIEHAALELFEAQGYEATTVEQIAARAEVGPATFFRYFPSKAEVVVGHGNQQLPSMAQAIHDRPAGENALLAIRHAVLDEWVAAVDPQLTARRSAIVASSDALSGLSYHRGRMWLDVFSAALAERRGVPPHDARCVLLARIALEALAAAVEGWIDAGCEGDLATAVEAAFDLTVEVCGELA
jgi:AcrR family transcriptional regulator